MIVYILDVFLRSERKQATVADAKDRVNAKKNVSVRGTGN